MLVEVLRFWLAFAAVMAARSSPTKDPIRAVIEESHPALEECYWLAHEGDPQIAGTVTVRFTIGASGHVESVHAEGITPDLDLCIATVFRSLAFPAPPGQRMNVTFPITFR